ncbi:hypothetical protein [Bradyrhizobium sp. ORS 111]|uniref:hypothetical protein n=1 Tax=Bradyrhizobium sp. ORS 111 TaxID=1685958 RepID=UPI00388D9B19
MISMLWSRKGAVLAAAIVTCTVLAALVSSGLPSPEPVSTAALGPHWQCSRVAFVFTSCTRTAQAGNKAMQVRAKEDCPPPGL